MTVGPTLDWPGLMRAGMRDLRLLPDQFWQLTPSELALMLGVEPAPARMTRDRLADLLTKFPDVPARAGVSVQPDGVTDGAE
ncbi:rcc01693 family protein [Paracoccus indicus]|uniref:rcc01693 family protein n=1 Tax=Paracoccus indicus TaxID=2079229 RepID=UPI000D373EC6|nr:rcc01693 family protein [Paracoccus indicus]